MIFRYCFNVYILSVFDCNNSIYEICIVIILMYVIKVKIYE